MGYENIVTLISTVGFPIAVSLVMMWVVYKMNEQHKEEMTKMTEALNNNTLALSKLAGKIGVDMNE